MGSNKSLQRTENIRSSESSTQKLLLRTYEARISDLRRVVTTLEEQLTAANTQNHSLVTQLAEAQSQVRMAMEDRYFHPQVSRTIDPKANRLGSPEAAEDVSQFDDDADRDAMGEAVGDLDQELEKIANEIQNRHPELAMATDSFGQEHQ